MLHVIPKGGYPEGVELWSNGIGELRGGIEPEELPKQLQRALDSLFSDDYGGGCYLVSHGDGYGVYVAAEYDADYAEDLGVTYQTLVSMARDNAAMMARERGGIDFVFAEDVSQWSDGKQITEIWLAVPWDAEAGAFREAVEWFMGRCYWLVRD